MKKFDIDIPADYQDSGTTCVRVVDYEDKETHKLVINGDLKVTDREEIEIQFDYPLSNAARFTFTNKGGFTILDMFRVIHQGYDEIYRSEDDPGYIPGMLNRNAGDGPYGIWGHYMSDLFIEEVVQVSPGRFTLGMGS
jgi:hypothetical protein